MNLNFTHLFINCWFSRSKVQFGIRFLHVGVLFMTFSVYVPNEITFFLVLHSNNFIVDRKFPREIIAAFHEFLPTKPCWIKLGFVLLQLTPFSFGWPWWSGRWMTIFIVSQISIWRARHCDEEATPTTSYSGMALVTLSLDMYISTQTGCKVIRLCKTWWETTGGWF